LTLPAGINTITVTGDYANVIGSAAAGAVVFTPSSQISDTSGEIILTGAAVTATLSNGLMSIVLPCTDNTTLRPVPFSYTVTQAIGGTWGQPFTITLPSTLGTSVDMSALVPQPSMAQPTPGLYVISLNGQSGAIVLPAGTITLTAGQATVALSSITTGSLVYLTVQTGAGTVGTPYLNTLTAGVGFTIQSTSASDASTVAYLVVPAAYA
jgi:hypothetical protein